MKTKPPFFTILGILLAIFVAVYLLFIWYGVAQPLFFTETPAEKAIRLKLRKENEVLDRLDFTLVDPEQAPESIRDLVKQGYHIMLNTPQYAGQYAGDRLSCTNCHFAAGDTTGGSNAGLSLAGVAAIYPKFDKRAGKVIDLPARINLCFERSMNGKPLPLDSHEMLALETYLKWISRGIPVFQNVPWLGINPIQTTSTPDPIKGKSVYSIQCASCHGQNGNGEVQNAIPPVWGPHSFNEKAGMNNQDTLASFIYFNMPYESRTLTIEEANNVAAYIIAQPHPK